MSPQHKAILWNSVRGWAPWAIFFTALTVATLFFVRVAGAAEDTAVAAPTFQEQINALIAWIAQVRSEYGTAGWAAAVGAFWYGCIAAFRIPLIQKGIAWASKLHPKMGWAAKLLWGTWPTWVKVVVAALPIGLATFFSTLASGAPVLTSLGAMVQALAVAFGARKAQKFAIDAPARAVRDKFANGKAAP